MLQLISRAAFLIGILIFTVQGLAQAQTNKDSRWSLAGSLYFRYEDNVFALSDQNQDSFKENSQNFPGIKSLDDFVWAASVGFSYRTIARKYPSFFSLGISGDFYTTNSQKSFETFRGGFRQDLGSETHASIGYTFIPRFFLGERIISSTATEAQTHSSTSLSSCLIRVLHPP
jgi:hypothetical protein